MEVRLVTPDAGAQPGELSPADGSGPRELLRYRSAQGRWVVAAMILGSSVAGIDSTVVAVALPAIGRNLHAGFQDLQWTVTSYTLTQSLEIRSAEIDKLTATSRKVTQLINQGILLESNEPEYLYTKLAELKVAMLADAAHDARERAAQIASSAGGKVGEMRSAEMGVMQVNAADANEISGYGVNDVKSVEKDVLAVVHATFALD